MSTTLTVADAVVTELNAASFSQAFTATRDVVPEFDATELASLAVTVVPVSNDMEQITRGQWKDEHEINIGIQKKLSGNVNTTIADMATLVKEIAVYMRNRSLSALSTVRPIECKIEPVYDADYLSGTRIFMSLIKITYRE